MITKIVRTHIEEERTVTTYSYYLFNHIPFFRFKVINYILTSYKESSLWDVFDNENYPDSDEN